MKNFIKTISLVSAFMPMAAQAQSLGKITNISGVATRLEAIGNVAIYLLVSLAVIYIVWNVVHYLIRPGADDKATAGMNILWGIVGLFVIVSLWGLVNILVNTFDTNPTGAPNRLPSTNFTSPNYQNTQAQDEWVNKMSQGIVQPANLPASPNPQNSDAYINRMSQGQ